METNAKTTIIDSDFRTGAIFYSLTNALLFSFSISCTVIFAKLSEKSTTFDGVNVLAMSIIAGIVSAISGGLFIYSLYKIIKVAEKRDAITRQLNKGVENVPEEEILTPQDKKLRNLQEAFKNKQMLNLPKNTSFLSKGLRGGIVG